MGRGRGHEALHRRRVRTEDPGGAENLGRDSSENVRQGRERWVGQRTLGVGRGRGEVHQNLGRTDTTG